MAVVRLGAAVINFVANNSQFLTAARQNAASIRRQQRAVRMLEREVRTFNRQAVVMGQRLAFLGTIGAAVAVRQFARFEETMATVRGVSAATGDQFRVLEQQARDLGRTTRFTSTQAAEGQLFLARAGFEVDQIYQALPSTLRLAQAGTLELGRAADIVSNVLQGFRTDAEETGRFVDVLASAANNSNTNLEQLGDAMAYVAPLAASLNVTVEETAALIGTLSDAGIQATLAGTGLRGVFAALIQPAGMAAAVLERYGLTVDEVALANNDALDVFRRLADANLSAGDALQIFGRRQVSAYLAIQSGIQNVEDLTDRLENSEGAAEALAEIMDATLRGAALRALSALEGFAFALISASDGSDTLQEALLGFARRLNAITDNMRAYLPLVHNVIGATLGLIVANSRAGRALFRIGFALLATETRAIAAASAMRALNRALIIGLAVEGVVLVSQAFLEARRQVEALPEALRELGQEVVDAERAVQDLGTETGATSEQFLEAANRVDTAREALSNLQEEAGRTMLGRVAENFGRLLLQLVNTLALPIAAIAGGVGALLNSVVEGFIETVVQLGGTIRTALLEGFTGGVAGFSAAFGTALATNSQQIGENISAAFADGLSEGLERADAQFSDLLGRSFFAARSLGEQGAEDILGDSGALTGGDAADPTGGAGAGALAESLSFGEQRLNQLREEGIRLTQGAEAALRYSLALREVSPERIEEIIQGQRVIDQLTAEERAREMARVEAERQQETVDRYIAGLDQQIARLSGGAEGLREYTVAQLAANEADAEQIRQKLELIDTLEAQAERTQRIEEVSRQAGEVFRRFGLDLVSSFDSVSDAVTRLRDRLLQLVLDQAILQPLANFISGGVTSLLTAAGLPGLAEGGVADGLAVVGERGPEIVDFKSPARVYPNSVFRDVVRGARATSAAARAFDYGAFIRSIPAYQSGGLARGLSLVGERGPEIAAFRGGPRIRPEAARAAAMPRGGAMNVTVAPVFNVEGEADARRMATLLPEMRRVAVEAVVEAMEGSTETRSLMFGGRL